MAKRREDRYSSMEDMLADLKAVREGRLPEFARRVATHDDLAELEATGKTVDITPPPTARVNIWAEPMAIVLAVVAGISVVLNLILLVMMTGK
jgi:hypothetical protein